MPADASRMVEKERRDLDLPRADTPREFKLIGKGKINAQLVLDIVGDTIITIGYDPNDIIPLFKLGDHLPGASNDGNAFGYIHHFLVSMPLQSCRYMLGPDDGIFFHCPV